MLVCLHANKTFKHRARKFLKQNPGLVCPIKEFMKTIKSSSRRRFKSVALIVMLLLLCSAAAIFVRVLPPSIPGAPGPGRSALRNARLDCRIGWYFKSGQWQADIQTLANVVSYWARSEEPFTNPPPMRVEAKPAPGLPLEPKVDASPLQ